MKKPSKFRSKIQWSKIELSQKRIEYIILRELNHWLKTQNAQKKTISELEALKIVS